MNRTPVKKPSRPAKPGTDLSALFNVAAQALAANQSSRNHADAENQNHGDNMVQALSMIAQSMANQRGSAPSTQLRHASQYLAQNAQSGSGQVYAQGLAQKPHRQQSGQVVANALLQAISGMSQRR